jgi:hypothetical protein
MWGDDVDEERAFVTESAIRHRLGSREEIELYEELSLALELMKNNNFKVTGSGIGGGIDFSITTQYPNGLPENVGTLFFNVSPKFDVRVKETPMYAYCGERHFQVKIKKG